MLKAAVLWRRCCKYFINVSLYQRLFLKFFCMSYLLFGALNRRSQGVVHSAQMRPKTPKSVVPFYHLLRPGLSCSDVGILHRYPPCKLLSRRSGYAASRKLFGLSGGERLIQWIALSSFWTPGPVQRFFSICGRDLYNTTGKNNTDF